MKIRRALTAAAAAAVIAPAAVLAAPAAAFATDPVPDTGPRTPATPGTPDTSDTAKPAQPPTDAPTNGGGTADPDDTETGGPKPQDDAGDTSGSRQKADGTESTRRKPGGSGAPDDPHGRPCAFESDQVRVAVHGLPAQLAADGPWSPFSMTLTNTTGKTLHEVQPYLNVTSAVDVDRPEWELKTQYHDPKSGRWKPYEDQGPGRLFDIITVGPHSTRTFQLRTHVVKSAKPGPGYAFAAADYRNRDGSCGSSKEGWYDFTILPVGAKPTQSPTAKPSEPGGTASPSQSSAPGGGTGGPASSGGPGPQGGNLAETGSSSALPAIGLAAGAAVVVGAGAVLVVRRRKALAGPGGGDTDATA
ncbi:LAETG motif-containing sortase-dependent surface protein [Streptomyces achromogenes]|uniref:LAETG motif-containing sortase-dependent surface protein n=1 Tax=Streptomyces achromogenes TaxID=67255 RepID=UPI0036AB2AD4